MNKVEYLKSLSKKICAVGALFLNEKGRVLVLETSYKKGWTIPGGVVDAKESLIVGLKREIKEEIDLDIAVSDLRLIEYKSGEVNGYFSESLQFIFFGGILDKEAIEKIKVDGGEIVSFDFLEKDEALKILSKNLSRRVERVLDNVNSKEVIFMSNGKMEL